VHLIAPNKGPSTGTTYDIIVGWGMYMSVPTRRRRIAFLRQLRTQTRVGCPILLSFFPRPIGSRQYHVSVIVSNMIRRMLRQAPAEVGDWLAPFYVHHFTQDEVASELAEGGFNIDYYSTTEYGHVVGIRV